MLRLLAGLPPRHHNGVGGRGTMKGLFLPGMRFIGLFGPWGRASIVAGLFLLSLGSTFAPLEDPWREALAAALSALGAYLVFTMAWWTQIGMTRISRAVERIA